MATHAGMSTADFEKICVGWLKTARHPRFNRPYTELVYQPMLELLAYLRNSGFKTFIVSGGGIEFMRSWTEQVYGVPPEEVVGSSIETRFTVQNGRAELIHVPEINFIDDGACKPVNPPIASPAICGVRAAAAARLSPELFCKTARWRARTKPSRQ